MQNSAIAPFEQDDMSKAPGLAPLTRNASEVYHFAAQVAVTTSLDQPVIDFETNVRGTFNLLEALRARAGSSAACFHFHQ